MIDSERGERVEREREGKERTSWVGQWDVYRRGGVGSGAWRRRNFEGRLTVSATSSCAKPKRIAQRQPPNVETKQNKFNFPFTYFPFPWNYSFILLHHTPKISITLSIFVSYMIMYFKIFKFWIMIRCLLCSKLFS